MALSSDRAVDQLLARYDTLDALIDQALDAIAAGDRERAILLGSAVVQQCSALDRRLAKLGALPECPP